MSSQSSGAANNVRRAQVALIGVPILLVALVIAAATASGGPRNATAPATIGAGLGWAQAEFDGAGFTSVSSHDALGRDRGRRDARDWVVCFQTPAQGEHPADTPVSLGAVQLGENCPATDQGVVTPTVDSMVTLVGHTAWWARESLGPDATVVFLDLGNDNREVSGRLGDWRVCSQTPEPGAPFAGEPVTVGVTDYAERCADPRPGRPREPSLLDRLDQALS